MRKLFRTIRRATRDSEAWPVVLLLLTVLVPAVCVLWFMGAAMRNERLAARQKLADAYRVGTRQGTRMADLLLDFALDLQRTEHVAYRERMTRAPVLMNSRRLSR